MKNRKIKTIVVAGARPNFMKCAPLLKELDRRSIFKTLFMHTGQHYDYEMSRVFFKHLKLRKPDVFLNVGSGSRKMQIQKVRDRFIKVARGFQPDIVMVVGDVNSTLGAAMGAKKVGSKVAHIEAGLRSFDMSMPEEKNRILTDSMSDFLFTTSKSASLNLAKENVLKSKIYFTGNVMIDTLIDNLRSAERSNILTDLRLSKKEYYVLTLHRPSNVDRRKTLKGILDTLAKIAEGRNIVFPVHPRTKKMLEQFRLFNKIRENPVFVSTNPVGYLDFLKLVRYSRAVFTDSGGIQEETAYLKIPCITLRENTERPVTVKAGNNIIAGNTPNRILKAFNVASKQVRRKNPSPIKFWDGKASQRIVKILAMEVNQ